MRISLIASGSTERRPSSALTVIGKKQIRATITIFGRDPEAEPDHQDRRDDDDRDRLRGDDQRVGGVRRTAPRGASRRRRRRRRRVRRRGRARSPAASPRRFRRAATRFSQSELGDFRRRGDEEVLEAERVGDRPGRGGELPERRAARRAAERQQPAPRIVRGSLPSRQRTATRAQGAQRPLADGDEGRVGDGGVAVGGARARARAARRRSGPGGRRGRRRGRRGRAPPRRHG